MPDETENGPLDVAQGRVEDAGIAPVGTSRLRVRARSHSFTDARQERICDRLSQIGPGPAGFFRDACFLIDNSDTLVMTAHMVGHSLREMESAVRQVLCATFGVHVPDGPEKHAREINALIEALGLPGHEPAAQAWLAIPSNHAGLQAWAHRRDLGRRELDAGFLVLWENVQVFLDVVLGVFEAESVRAFGLADRLMSVDPPTEASVSSFMGDLIKATGVIDHVARNIPLSWFEPLVEARFFDDVPSLDDLGEGDGWEPLRWPQVELLRRAAADEALRLRAWEVVERVGLKNNPPLHVDLADIGLAAPPADAIRLVPLATGWLVDERGFLLIDRLTRLVEHLIAGGHPDAAFQLSESILHAAEAQGA
jgi:hypothetical protein